MSRRIASSVCFAVLVVLACGAPSPSGAGALDPGSPAFAQAEKPRVTTRVRHWTRARFDALKKRWAQDNAKFSACSSELAETKKTNRMSVRRQVRFMEACMRRP